MPDVPIVPVTPSLDAAIKQAVRDIPAGRTLQANATITNRGIGASFGWQPKPSIGIGGYAGKLWGGGWEAGARLQILK